MNTLSWKVYAILIRSYANATEKLYKLCDMYASMHMYTYVHTHTRTCTHTYEEIYLHQIYNTTNIRRPRLSIAAKCGCQNPSDAM